MASITARSQPSVTPEEYLVLERSAAFKSEYLHGQIYAMAGGSPEHGAITVNLAGELRAQLRDKPCQVFYSDVKVRTRPDGLFAYPDLSVVCGELRFHDAHRDVLTNPILIAEVLSPSTEGYDRGKKFLYYRQIETLQQYLLVSQEEPYIDLYHKEAEGRWSVESIEGLDKNLFLPSIECTLKLSESMRRSSFARSKKKRCPASDHGRAVAWDLRVVGRSLGTGASDTPDLGSHRPQGLSVPHVERRSGSPAAGVRDADQGPDLMGSDGGSATNHRRRSPSLQRERVLWDGEHTFWIVGAWVKGRMFR